MPDDGPAPTALGKIVIFLFIAGCIGAGVWYFLRGNGGPGASGSGTAGGTSAPLPADGGGVAIGIAYGTEKKTWLEWAVGEFQSSKEGRGITVNLIPKGSLQGAQAILADDKSINAWAPASALAKDALVLDWQVRHGGNPIAQEEILALTPMVFVWWKERHDAFAAKYKSVDFLTIGEALAEKTGWAGIANKPEWGLFKFGHTNPSKSNSGQLTLIGMAYDFHKKDRGLTLAEVLDARFQTWLAATEGAATGLANDSTGTMMREMVLKGPSAYDCLFVYESVAVDFLKNAEGRWGALTITYPVRNVWNDNPFYILDVPWSSPAQRQACARFLAFLLSEPVQKRALVHGFRPGNTQVPVLFPGSPFEQFKAYGLRNDVSATSETPRGEVVQNLMASFQRTQAGR
jgi:hypothetical protein